MARLDITGFLSIEQASIDLHRFTVFIGPQAQGKSLILKLLHFFESVVSKAVLDVVTGELTFSALRKDSLERFEAYFPKYAWGTSAFTVKFVEGDFEISISRAGGRKNNPAVFQIGAALENILKSTHATYKARLEILEAAARPRALIRRNLISEILTSVEALTVLRSEPVFIPASRSFFANIERNIFALISSKFEFDPLMAEFGTMLESTRRNLLMFDAPIGSGPRKRTRELRRSTWTDIIDGDYLYDGEEEAVERDGRRVRIGNSSSGQQEAIPLLLVLEFFSGEESYSYGRLRGTSGASFFVEEPEAHLFPKAQKAVAALLIEAMNRQSLNRIIFTTHSPYMLTAVNNLHLAGQIYAKLPTSSHKALRKVAAIEQTIGVGELAAYKVDKGRVLSIMDQRSGLVNGMLIDEVSSEFATDFDYLLSLAGPVLHSA